MSWRSAAIAVPRLENRNLPNLETEISVPAAFSGSACQSSRLECPFETNHHTQTLSLPSRLKPRAPHLPCSPCPPVASPAPSVVKLVRISTRKPSIQDWPRTPSKGLSSLQVAFSCSFDNMFVASSNISTHANRSLRLHKTIDNAPCLHVRHRPLIVRSASGAAT